MKVKIDNHIVYVPNDEPRSGGIHEIAIVFPVDSDVEKTKEYAELILAIGKLQDTIKLTGYSKF